MDNPTPPQPNHDAAGVPVPIARVEKGSRGLYLIAIFELVKTVLFLVAAAGVFHLVKRDTQVELTRLLHAFRISGDSHFIKDLLLRANVITDPGKRILSGVALLYALLHATEGIGLLLRQRWAEYFTVIMTALPLPYEVYLLVHHTTHSKVVGIVPPDQKWLALFSQHIFVIKIFVLLANLGIVYYLVYHLRRSVHRHFVLPENRHEEGQDSPH